MNYYTYNPSTKTLTPAPRVVVRDGRTIILGAAKDFARYLSAYPRAASDPAPVPPEGKVANEDGFRLENNEWHRAWRFDDPPPPPPRVFETADLVEALMEEGIWPDVRAWIEAQGLLDLVLATKEFDETNKNFAAGRAALQTALSWTNAEVEEFLDKCVKEGV